jgi:hypothetical protein
MSNTAAKLTSTPCPAHLEPTESCPDCQRNWREMVAGIYGRNGKAAGGPVPTPGSANWHPSMSSDKDSGISHCSATGLWSWYALRNGEVIGSGTADSKEEAQRLRDGFLSRDGRAILITGGIGDVFALECLMSPEMRETLTDVYYACPAQRQIAELWGLLPNFPRLKNHHFLPSGPKVYHSHKEAHEELGIPPGVEDWSIAAKFPSQWKFYGSSFSTRRLWDSDLIRDCSFRHVAIVPHSYSNPTWDGRQFGPDDWKVALRFLEERDLGGLVLGHVPVSAPNHRPIPNHKRLINLINKTTIAEACELTKVTGGYIGIDTCFSVLASHTKPANRILIKSVNDPHMANWKHVYYAPRRAFPFIKRKVIDPWN